MKRFAILFVLVACSANNSGGAMSGDDTPGIDAGGSGTDPMIDAPAMAAPRTVFVIPLEHKCSAAIYGNTSDAPYINGLFASAAHSTNFQDALPNLPSEPHYVLMEAGTNAFSDRTFTGDGDASSSNVTASTEHLTAQLMAAGIPWM